MKYRLLLTSAGAMVMPGIVESLRADTGDEFHLVGVDQDPDAVGLHFLDEHFIVPSSEAPGFPAAVLEIARAQGIDLVIPCSDGELLALAKAKRAFADEGIVIGASDYGTVATACDKAAMLQFLVDSGLPCADFCSPASVAELKQAARSLGYPEKRIVFKPTRSSGARGLWIIDAKIRKDRDLIFSRERQSITLDWLCEALEEAERFPEVVLMEYLPGADFNVDILAKHGKSLYTIANERIVPHAGPVRVGRIRADTPAQQLCARIVEAFGFDYWINIEVAYSDAHVPLAYEINPRISAPIVFNTVAGVNLLKLGVQLALGAQIDETLAARDTRVMRYWSDLAISGKESH